MRRNRFNYVDSLTTRIALASISDLNEKETGKKLICKRRFLKNSLTRSKRNTRGKYLSDVLASGSIYKNSNNIKSIFPSKEIEEKMLKNVKIKRKELL